VWSPRARSRFSRNRGAVVGAALVLALVLFAIAGPWLTSRGPLASDFRLGADADANPVGPSATFLLGADRLFRDELARLAYGARLSLAIAIVATLIATLLGAAVGIVAGYSEGSEGVRVPWPSLLALVTSLWLWTDGHGRAAALVVVAALVFIALASRVRGFGAGPRVNLDAALMRVVEVGLAFPFLLLVMAIGAALERTTAATIMVTLGLTGWLGTARVIRSKTLSIRNLDFVLASRALGQSTWRVLWRHVVPNVAGPLIVIATISVAQMIVAESVLSYLGAGVAPPTPTWGQMLFEGQDYYQIAPWTLIAPAVAILTAVFGFNLLGEGLRDALDPQED
jgi:ABC-type dipeptide/oligopeptide/nickel transport system permease subunit